MRLDRLSGMDFGSLQPASARCMHDRVRFINISSTWTLQDGKRAEENATVGRTQDAPRTHRK